MPISIEQLNNELPRFLEDSGEVLSCGIVNGEIYGSFRLRQPVKLTEHRKTCGQDSVFVTRTGLEKMPSSILTCPWFLLIGDTLIPEGITIIFCLKLQPAPNCKNPISLEPEPVRAQLKALARSLRSGFWFAEDIRLTLVFDESGAIPVLI